MKKTPDRDFVSDLSKRAGELVLTYFKHTRSGTEKSGYQGIVTEADLASEKLIKAEILKAFPDHSILAEESGEQSGKDGSEQGIPFWLIDPLDGTANFAKGNPYFCVSIAYGIRRGECVDVQVAAVYHPVLKDLYSAEKGAGAWLGSTRLSGSPETQFRLGSYTTGFGACHGDELREVTATIYRVQEACTGTAVRVNGAAALDLARLAAGTTDGFWELNLNAWDTAAGALLVQETGGILTNAAGAAFDALRDRTLIAAPPALHAELARQVLSAELPGSRH